LLEAMRLGKESGLLNMPSEAYDVVAAIYVHDFAGDGAGKAAGEEEGRAADLKLVYVAMDLEPFG